MLNNLVNADDVAVVVRKVVNGHAGEVAARLGRKDEARIESHWHDQWDAELPPVQWFDLPKVRRRENRMISGDEDVSYFRYITEKYLAERVPAHGVSLGCGSGWRELEWARQGGFESLAAYDISEAGIRQARADAEEAGLAGIVDFRVGSVNALSFEPASLDVIVIEDALHHFAPLDELIPRIRSWLKPNGLLIVNEYVGPTQCQYTERQVELADAMLTLLPEHLRRDWDGRLKRRVPRPSRMRMRIKDPSEAVESARIMPLLRRTFEIAEERQTGGTIVYLVLDGIAHNFLRGDARAQRMLELCFEWEERLIYAGEITSDHALAVCRRT